MGFEDFKEQVNSLMMLARCLLSNWCDSTSSKTSYCQGLGRLPVQ